MTKRQENKPKGKGPLLSGYIRQRVADKRQMGKNSTADLYLAAGNHFLEFQDNREMLLCGITPTMVTDFQGYLHSKGLKINTINSYLSSLRAVYNAAADDKLFRVKLHPFHKLKLKRDMPVKKPLSEQQVMAMATTDFRDRPELALATDLSLFSFMAYGMPFVDMVLLTKKNIRGQAIVYNRHKTGIEIRIEITAGMWQIIRKYESADREYLFPVMFASATYGQYKAMLASHNEALKEVGRLLAVSDNLTSYVMRYTWASEARRQHVDIAVISQALGHTSEKTTRGYFNRLDQPELDLANRRITDSVNRILADKVKKKSLGGMDRTYL
ncbi:tyrosine-type recombinase/integrase [Parabacteroides sp.]